MQRHLLCKACARRSPLHPADTATFKARLTIISVKVPPELDQIVCDACCCEIKDGTFAIAETIWRKEEPQPKNWETLYGVIMPGNSAQVAQALELQDPINL